MATHPSFDTNEERAEYLKSLVVKGQKIMAIHFVRESEGLGLAESKDKVEEMHNELSKLPEGHPDRPAQRQGMPSWLIPFIVICVIIIAGIWIYLSQ